MNEITETKKVNRMEDTVNRVADVALAGVTVLTKASCKIVLGFTHSVIKGYTDAKNEINPPEPDKVSPLKEPL